jgi:hypothetical protein
MRTAITTLFALAVASTAHGHPHNSECTSTTTVSPVATADSTAELLRELVSAPTALDRARQLLVEGDVLRTGDDLKQLIVFDFNEPQSASGALGGASKAAVSIRSTLRGKL